jgi:hypothetical protein
LKQVTILQPFASNDSANKTVKKLLELSRCELLLLEAGSWGRRQFGEQEERRPLEAVTTERQRKHDFRS